jgi:hypothetical protein
VSLVTVSAPSASGSFETGARQVDDEEFVTKILGKATRPLVRAASTWTAVP